ncbi:MAG TPA: DUF4337 domain-containing protein [Thermoanaerobaculia bacterium]|jgi:hypothetical protein|nr:DUF4337 domain-containing protein [Thermoanaerobaculia bacterium]
MVAEKIEAAPAAEREPEEKGRNFEVLCGLVIALFAAILAVTDLGAGKFGDDELIAHNEKNNAYLWFQSKGIKETLVEGQRDTLKTLVQADSIRPEQLAAIEGLIGSLDAKAARYGKEKTEILQGSAAVGQANWVQDVDGEMGKVVGAKGWESQAAALGGAGDTFDMATLFLQICLVVGAISLVVQSAGTRRAFFLGMIVLGVVGSVFSVLAFQQAFGIG